MRRPYYLVLTKREIEGLVIDGRASIDLLPPGNTLRPTFDPEPEATLVAVMLHAGRMSLCRSQVDEEGPVVRSMDVHEAVDEQGNLGWALFDETKGKDCGGDYSWEWYGWSDGGIDSTRWLSDCREVSRRHHAKLLY